MHGSGGGVTLEQWPVPIRRPHRCATCGRVPPVGATMLRCRWLDGIYGGFHGEYLCARCPWPRERRKADWRRRVPGRHGPKSAAGRYRCYLSRNGLTAEATR